MALRAALLALLCAAALTAAAAPQDAAPQDPVPLPFAANTGVTEITTAAAARKMLRRGDDAALVYCYDSAETNSWRASRAIADAAQQLAGLVSVYAIDVRNPRLRWLQDSWGVQLVPTVRGIPAGRTVRKSAEGTPLANIGGVRQPREWPQTSPLVAGSLKAFALRLLTDQAVQKLQSDDQVMPLLQAVTTSDRPTSTVVLLTNKAQTSQLYKAVSTRYVGRLEFVEVFTTRASSAQGAFAASKVPALMLFDKTGKKHAYGGAFTAAALQGFLEPFAGDRDAAFAAEEQAQQAVLDREGARRAHTVFPITTQDDMNALVLSSQAPVGVFFVAPADAGDIEATVAAYVKKHGKKRTAHVHQFVWVDRTKHAALAAVFGVTGDDSQPLVFVGPGRYVPFVGSLSQSGLHSFIGSKLSRMDGAKPFDPRSLPQI